MPDTNTTPENTPTGATYRIETLSDMLAVPPRRVGYLMTDLAIWMATAQGARDSVAEMGGKITMPTGMDWRDDGEHIGGVKMTDGDGKTILELKFDAKAMGIAGPALLPPLTVRPVTTTPEPKPTLAQALANASAQLVGLIDACGPFTAEDRDELNNLAGFLKDASEDAAALEMPVRIVCEIEDGLLQSVYADRPVDVATLDFDTEGGDPADLESVPQFNIIDGCTPRPAFVDDTAANWSTAAIAYVHAIHERPEPCEPDRDTDQTGNTVG